MGKASLIRCIALFVASCIMATTTAAPTPNCGITHLRPRPLMNRFVGGSWLVVDLTGHTNHVGTPRRRTRSIGDNEAHNGRCSWRYTIDEDRSRIPRLIPKAELTCTNCSRFCKPTFWEHEVLVKGCNRLRSVRRKVPIWKKSTASLPISFVDDY